MSTPLFGAISVPENTPKHSNPPQSPCLSIWQHEGCIPSLFNALLFSVNRVCSRKVLGQCGQKAPSLQRVNDGGGDNGAKQSSGGRQTDRLWLGAWARQA